MRSSLLSSCLVLVSLLVATSLAQITPTAFSASASCTASSDNACFVSFFGPNPQNLTINSVIINVDDDYVTPPTMTATSSDKSYTIYACFTGGAVPVNDLKDNCGFGLYGSVKTSTTSSSKRSVNAVESSKSDSATLNFPVSYPRNLISYVDNDDANVTYTVSLTGYSCPSNTFYYNNQCWDMLELKQGAPLNFTLGEDNYQYFYYVQNGYANFLQFLLKTDTDPTISHNSLELEVSNTFLPDGAYQTDAIVTDARNYRNRTIIGATAGRVWYIGVKNTDSKNHTGYLSVVVENCFNSTAFGENCATLTPQTLTPSTNFSAPPASFTVDDDGDPVYFVLDADETKIGTFLRVSVAGDDNQPAPALYAQPNSPPSASSFSVNSTTGSNVNQALLPISTAKWYLTVVGEPGQVFYIWAGTNCVSNCSTDGTCNCGNGACDNSEDGIYNPIPTPDPNAILYLTDSYGQCACKSDDYISFDCGIDINTFKTIYIVLIAIGGAIVLAVAIGVPIYCYLQNKSPRYQRL